MPQPKSSGGSGRGKRTGGTGNRRRATAGAKRSSASPRAASSGRTSRATAGRATGPTKAPARKPAARRGSSASSSEGLRDALRRGVLAPLNAVMLTRERIQEAMDDAVRRGRMTRDDANELVRELVRLGRRQTEDVLADLEQLIGKSAGQLGSAATRARKAQASDRALREVDRARRVAGLGPSFPILGYDDLSARQVTERLTDLTAAQLRKIRDHERRHANRKSVLSAIERKLG